ncbi:hypothetical protein MPS_1200 [Mycobacterium pseudoshottsii JCM 15466]|nr:hypothetical protein MPS_1200 [Mycobacterium pseudoshottsii JCM 15466]
MLSSEVCGNFEFVRSGVDARFPAAPPLREVLLIGTGVGLLSA